jgi:hypothetical protein
MACGSARTAPKTHDQQDISASASICRSHSREQRTMDRGDRVGGSRVRNEHAGANDLAKADAKAGECLLDDLEAPTRLDTCVVGTRPVWPHRAGPVPETSTRVPTWIARENPIACSYGEPEAIRIRLAPVVASSDT